VVIYVSIPKVGEWFGYSIDEPINALSPLYLVIRQDFRKITSVYVQTILYPRLYREWLMDQKFTREATENNPKTRTRRKFHKIRLEELQQYFDYNMFYLEDYDKNDDYDEELYLQYREQVIEFLYSIGAMVNVEQFLDVEGNGIVYARKLPPGIMPIQEEL
jgi:hypothetical protein